jgi:hypothetical protein
MVPVGVGLVAVREQFAAIAATEITKANRIPRVDGALEISILTKR